MCHKSLLLCLNKKNALRVNYGSVLCNMLKTFYECEIKSEQHRSVCFTIY
jgi:hypothetical protein